jgi:hypothetical protein
MLHTELGWEILAPATPRGHSKKSVPQHIYYFRSLKWDFSVFFLCLPKNAAR